MDVDHVVIFDTTLRDGEQSPGATLNTDEKLEIARQLERLRVDVIEAGFPASSPGDLDAVRRVAREVTGSSICGLARCVRSDIDAAWEAVRDAAKPRIHVFIATSDIHLEHKLRMTRQQVLERTRSMVAYARSLCSDIEFSPEDGTRSDPEFLYEVLGIAIAEGATTLNIPDTVGYTNPVEFAQLIRGIRQHTPGIEKAIISVHCHNDLGMATANSLAAVMEGARQIECTINGLGERAGNAALEEIVMALHTRRSFYGIETAIVTQELYPSSRMVSSFTGLSVQANKAIVGANAFAHEAGIHQDGILKNRLTYEIMDAHMVGLGENTLVLGKHSGRHAFADKLDQMGYHLDGEELNRAFARFKELADKKKTLDDRDLEAIVSDEIFQPDDVYRLVQIQVSAGDRAIPTATVTLESPDGALITDAAHGTGPVDAVYKAINRIVQVPNELIEFSVNAVTEGIDAVGEVTIRIQAELNGTNGLPVNAQTGRHTYLFSGHGASTDIIVASGRAYMSALNKLIAVRQASALVAE
ncbi:MAG: 2-isopropylmalate synthase [Anaerolineae bacterium]|jgi:2-isopropylmalate synthase|nr:2-isopropylmalate synthase [Chloroflexota bacterium]